MFLLFNVELEVTLWLYSELVSLKVELLKMQMLLKLIVLLMA